MLLQTSTLAKISTKNLLKLTLEQSQLELNFQLILKALTSHDLLFNSIQSKIGSLEGALQQANKEQIKIKDISSSSNDKIMVESQKTQKVQKNIQLIQQKMMDLELKVGPSNINPESKIDKNDEEMLATIKLLENNMKLVNEKVSQLESKSNKIKQLENHLNQAHQRINKLEQQKRKTHQIIYKAQALQKAKPDPTLSKMQNHNIDSQLKQTQGEKKYMPDQQIKRLINQINKNMETKLDELRCTINELQKQSKNDKSLIRQIEMNIKNQLTKQQKQHNNLQKIVIPAIPKLKEGYDDLQKQVKKLSDDVWKLNDQLYLHQSQPHDTITSFLNKKIEELQFKLNQHLQDHPIAFGTQRYAMSAKKERNQQIYKPEVKLQVIMSNKKEVEKEDFKKQIIDKLKQQKGDFNKALKKLDIMSGKKDDQKLKINTIQQKILRIEHLLEGKVDEEGLHKWMRYIQNKIGYLYRIVNVGDSEEDACIARKNFFCLSCDKKLDNYKGKLGNHIVSGGIKGKTIDNQIIGGGMLFKSKSRYELPHFKKEK